MAILLCTPHWLRHSDDGEWKQKRPLCNATAGKSMKRSRTSFFSYLNARLLAPRPTAGGFKPPTFSRSVTSEKAEIHSCQTFARIKFRNNCGAPLCTVAGVHGEEHQLFVTSLPGNQVRCVLLVHQSGGCSLRVTSLSAPRLRRILISTLNQDAHICMNAYWCLLLRPTNPNWSLTPQRDHGCIKSYFLLACGVFAQYSELCRDVHSFQLAAVHELELQSWLNDCFP